MLEFIKKAVASHKNPFTETDGSWCLKRIMATTAGSVMIYKFCVAGSAVDYLSFGGGLSAIFAALAFVNKMEATDKMPEENKEC